MFFAIFDVGRRLARQFPEIVQPITHPLGNVLSK
jgi:hypothetical protein